MIATSVEHSPQQVVDDAFAEATRRDPDHRLRWIVLVDGQRDQNRRVQRAGRPVLISWKSRSIVSLRKDFVLTVRGEDMTVVEACEHFGMSRKTGYKWLQGYDDRKIRVSPSVVSPQPVAGPGTAARTSSHAETADFNFLW